MVGSEEHQEKKVKPLFPLVIISSWDPGEIMWDWYSSLCNIMVISPANPANLCAIWLYKSPLSPDARQE